MSTMYSAAGTVILVEPVCMRNYDHSIVRVVDQDGVA